MFLMRYFHFTVEEFHSIWNLDNCEYYVLEKNERNPDPTTMPPPTAGLAGAALGERHVISFIGLPARGKQVR